MVKNEKLIQIFVKVLNLSIDTGKWMPDPYLAEKRLKQF